jgi:hypothetical protein
MEKLLNVSLSAMTASGKREAAEEGEADFSIGLKIYIRYTRIKPAGSSPRR